MHVFALSTWVPEAGRTCEFEASLDYVESSKPARVTEDDSFSKTAKLKKANNVFK